MSQMWIFVLAFLFTSQVVSSAQEEGDFIGSCRYEKTSVAALSCAQPDGNWRPPSTSCCKALLYAVDELPASSESGACCLCRYMRAKPVSIVSPGLAITYVLCQGKDSHLVKTWTNFPITSSCQAQNRGCPKMNSSSPAQKDGGVIHTHGSGKTIFKSIWAVAAVATCVVFLICVWYFWWVKPSANGPKSSQSGRGRSQEDGPKAESNRSDRRTSAQQRRMSSSRSSPNN